MLDSTRSISFVKAHVQQWTPLVVALAIIVALLIAARWAPDALWPLVQVAPYLMRGVR